MCSFSISFTKFSKLRFKINKIGGYFDEFELLKKELVKIIIGIAHI
ncbi:hypothetical protein [Aliarcobacter skirrowii]|nr:hypothetical protein [Aliarcobacter skirrowii]